MTDHRNAILAREAMDAFRSGDIGAYREFFHEGVVWHVGGQNHLSGDYRGRDALFEYFDHVKTLTAGTLTVEPLEILAEDGHCAIFSRVVADRDDKHLDVILVQAFTVDADGHWTEHWALADDQDAVDAFWSLTEEQT